MSRNNTTVAIVYYIFTMQVPMCYLVIILTTYLKTKIS